MEAYQNKRQALREWQKSLTQEMLELSQYKISLYHHLTGQKPIAVFIHGFGGNYYGLVPLAYELKKQYDVIICELPAHGKSRLDSFSSVADSHQFYYDVIQKLKAYGNIQLVVGHSFGAYLVSDARVSSEIPTVMINPVFAPTASFVKASQLSQASNLTMTLCNLSLFAPVRAFFLEKVYNQEALKNIGRNIITCRNSLRQLMTQRTMIFISLAKDAFARENSVGLAIVGEKDNLVYRFDRAVFEHYFPKAEAVALSGGHLLPLERPEETAQAILDYVASD